MDDSELLTKTVCILANSIKHGGRCIAGVEVRESDHGFVSVGRWIRPVSNREKGEIRNWEAALENKPGSSQPEILDIVEIPIHRPANITGQPEDWVIQPGKKWIFHGKFSPSSIQGLVQNPQSIWNIEHERQDRVPADVVQRRNLPSLYFVRVNDFRIEIVEKIDCNSGQLKKKRRARFSYLGTNHDLALTDPVMQKKYFPTFPNVPAGIVHAPRSTPHLCISLAPEFNGYHYKIVAAVIE